MSHTTTSQSLSSRRSKSKTPYLRVFILKAWIFTTSTKKQKPKIVFSGKIHLKCSHRRRQSQRYRKRSQLNLTSPLVKATVGILTRLWSSNQRKFLNIILQSRLKFPLQKDLAIKRLCLIKKLKADQL